MAFAQFTQNSTCWNYRSCKPKECICAYVDTFSTLLEYILIRLEPMWAHLDFVSVLLIHSRKVITS